MPVRIRHVLHPNKVEALFIPQSATYRDILRRAIRVQNSARRRAPVDTGRLRSSIQIDAPHYVGQVAGARVYTDVEYAIYQEMGTRFMAAHPFLRPALRDARN